MSETGNLGKLIQTALENIKGITDVNTIVGDPVSVSGGTTIIPVSKVSMGFTSGGTDFISKKNPEKEPNFGGGVGSGFSLVPMAFLVVDKDGNVSLISIDNPTGAGDNNVLGTINNIIEKTPSIVEKLTKIFKKDKKSKEDDSEAYKSEESSATVFTNEDVQNIENEANPQ